MHGKAGFGLASMVHISLARHEQKHVDNFVREVLRHPEVLECFATSGEADFHLRVVVEDIDAYNKFLDDFIFKLPGVSQVRSNIVLKEIKADTALRSGFDGFPVVVRCDHGQHIVLRHDLIFLVGDLAIPANLAIAGVAAQRLLFARQPDL